jgi:hypothetical protein
MKAIGSRFEENGLIYLLGLDLLNSYSLSTSFFLKLHHEDSVFSLEVFSFEPSHIEIVLAGWAFAIIFDVLEDGLSLEGCLAAVGHGGIGRDFVG